MTYDLPLYSREELIDVQECIIARLMAIETLIEATAQKDRLELVLASINRLLQENHCGAVLSGLR